ncbi:MAG: hypothetical protein V4760_01145 [Bdellovibrionota bacterium]
MKSILATILIFGFSTGALAVDDPRTFTCKDANVGRGVAIDITYGIEPESGNLASDELTSYVALPDGGKIEEIEFSSNYVPREEVDGSITFRGYSDDVQLEFELDPKTSKAFATFRTSEEFPEYFNMDCVELVP